MSFEHWDRFVKDTIKGLNKERKNADACSIRAKGFDNRTTKEAREKQKNDSG